MAKATWDANSTTALIESMKARNAVKLRELNAVSCSDLFGKVQADLMEKGYDFKIAQIRNKWKKLRQQYYAKCDLLKAKPDSTATIYRWHYFNDMHEMLHNEVRRKRSGPVRVFVSKAPRLDSTGMEFSGTDDTESFYEQDEEEHVMINGVSMKKLMEESSHDDRVVAALIALINTIREEREKDREAAREDREAFLAALNNVASTIQSSTREIISALKTSST